MSQLVALPQDLEICATAVEFVEKCSGSQYEVAILPFGVLPQDDRMLLQSYLNPWNCILRSFFTRPLLLLRSGRAGLMPKLSP
jgi:hypothetical protein